MGEFSCRALLLGFPYFVLVLQRMDLGLVVPWRSALHWDGQPTHCGRCPVLQAFIDVADFCREYLADCVWLSTGTSLPHCHLRSFIAPRCAVAGRDLQLLAVPGCKTAPPPHAANVSPQSTVQRAHKSHCLLLDAAVLAAATSLPSQTSAASSTCMLVDAGVATHAIM